MATNNSQTVPVFSELPFSEKQYEKEAAYAATMAFFRNLLTRGFITDEEYGVIDTRMQKKYHPVLADLYR